MKSLITLFLVSISCYLFGQVDSLKHFCSIDNMNPPETIYPIAPSQEAQKIIDTLLKYIPVSKNTIDFYASDINKACAAIINGRRVVYFNEDYLEGIQENQKTRWAIYFVLAHEIAHHLNADPLDKNRNRLMSELEADCQAAKVLALMKATKDETLAVMNEFNLEDTETHPRRSARKAQARNCWTDVPPPDIPVSPPGRDSNTYQVKNCNNKHGEAKIINNTSNGFYIKIRINGNDEQAKQAKRILDYKLEYVIEAASQKIIHLPPANYTISLHKQYAQNSMFMEQAPKKTENLLIKKCTGYPISIER